MLFEVFENLFENESVGGGLGEELFHAAVLERIYGNDFFLVAGGRHGLPLVMPARNES